MVYTDHRSASPTSPAAALTSPRSGAPAWLPAIGGAEAALPPGAYEQAVGKILAVGCFRLRGHYLVRGLASCDPDAVVAVAGAIHAAWARGA